jgi:hypothetical protein
MNNQRQVNSTYGTVRAMALALSGVALVTLASCQASGSGGAEAEAAAERPATKAEIEAIAVGRTVNGAMRYGTDGSYTYEGRNPGTYRISNGQICVNFQSGGRRCDRIVTDGSTYTMINSNGQRFRFG